MFERIILGLDVGSYAVKAAELRAGMRGVEFVRFEEALFPLDATQEERQELLRDFLDEYNLRREFVVAALPTDRGTQRHIRFPFSDPRRVSQALPFELEEHLPLPLDELIVSHERVLLDPERADVLAVMAPRSAVGAWLESLRASGVEPRILEVEGAAFANLSSYLRLEDPTHLIMDLGHRKTNLCLLVDGKPVLVRSIPIGGASLTDALALDLRRTREAADAQKRDLGIFEPGSTKPVCAAVSHVLDRLVRETLRTLQSLVSQPSHSTSPQQVVTVGGSSALPGLDAFLGEKLGLPCQVLRVLPGDEGRSLFASVGPERFALAAALALRGSQTARVTRINFRQEEFQYTPDLSDLRRSLRPSLALLIILLVFWLASLGVQLFDYGRQATALELRFATVYQVAFPNAPETADPMAAIEGRVRETRELANHLGVTGHNQSPLDILNEIQARFPDAPDIGLSEVQIERYAVQARGFAPSFEAVDRIRAELTKAETFESVRLSDVVTDPKRGGKGFSLSIGLVDVE